MRTTITFDGDVAAAVRQLRQQKSQGISAIVNDLIRAGLRERQERAPFAQDVDDMGMRLDVSNIGELLDLIEGPDHR